MGEEEVYKVTLMQEAAEEDKEQAEETATKEEEKAEDGYPVVNYGAAVPEHFRDSKMEKKMKKVIKEGGKRGVEIEGAADMGGLQFFITPVEEPENDMDMLVESMRSMNAESDPSEEERKGGSGKIGKTIFSMTDDKINMVAYVPE